MDWTQYAPNPTNPPKGYELTKAQARGLRHMYLDRGMATPHWDSLHFLTVQDKFGARGFEIVDRLVAQGILDHSAPYWTITERGKVAFRDYVQKHGMPRRRY